MKTTPTKQKVEETVSHPKASKLLVWSDVVDAPPQQMEREIVSIMIAFPSASVYTLEELAVKVDKRELQIRDLQNQKVDLENTIAQQSTNLKFQYDTLLEQEKAQHLKELDDIRSLQVQERSKIEDENSRQVAFLEQPLFELKINVGSIEEFRTKEISVNNILKNPHTNFYHVLSEIQQIYYDISSANKKLDERITKLHASQEAIISVENQENEYEGHHLDIPRLSIMEFLTYHAMIEKWDNTTAYASQYFQEDNAGCLKLWDVAKNIM